MLKQIQYFQSVVRCGSFTMAAEQCFISQSAISQQIQALEQALGVKLLERGNRSFTVTPAGEYFYQKSLVLLADYQKLCRETVKISRKGKAELRLGYLKGYDGHEFQLALSEFSEKHPEVDIIVITGNHEELYNALRTEQIDLVLNDQRRAFSDEYQNLLLTRMPCYIEIATRNPIAQADSVDISDLKNTPCILVVSPGQEENEREFYRDIVGFSGGFLFAENLEEARLMVIGGSGVMPIEGGENPPQFGTTLHRVPLMRNGNPIERNYCVFWKLDNSGYYIEEFAGLLKDKF